MSNYPKSLLEEIPGVEVDGVWSLESLEEKVFSPMQWGTVGTRMYKGFSSTHQKLPPGAYFVTLDRNDNQVIFVKKDLKSDELLDLEGSLAHEVIPEIINFWGQKENFRKMKVLHRRGYLFYGPQGTGKSSLVNLIMHNVIEQQQGIVLICDNPKFFSQALTTFRKIEPNRPIMCVYEDIDAIIKKYGEDELLSVLDGTNMVDTVINVATTNYPEQLDGRIVSRPRRFDRVYKILFPSDIERRGYLQKKLPKKANLEKWMRATKDLSFAGITEAVISVYCLNNDFEETIRTLRDLEGGNPSSDSYRRDFGGSVGFTTSEDLLNDPAEDF